MNSEDNIQPLIGRRFILPFIALFFANILFFCYELNTGFEQKINERLNLLKLVFVITIEVNAVITALTSITICEIIGNKYNFGKTYKYFPTILSFVTYSVCYAARNCSLAFEISTDSRLQMQCTIFLVSEIGLFVLYFRFNDILM